LQLTKGYTISGLYQLLSSEEFGGRYAATNIIWNKAILLKVTLFAW